MGSPRLLSVVFVGSWTAIAQALVPFTGATTIAAGSISKHTCVITGGAAKCWGDNGNGQLGDGSTTPSLIPIQVAGLTSGATSLAVGNFHTCALVSGGVKCWGNNISGQLGDGTTTPRLTLVAVSGLTNGVAAIAAGALHTCALTTGGAVKCWGANTNGQLGDNTTTSRTAPVSVSGLASGVVAIAAGQTHTCAVTSAGAVKCWGLNANGQLGDNTTTQRLIPAPVSGVAIGATAIAGGTGHTCALVSGGVKCWGNNANGQVGDNTQIQRLTPVDVVGLSSGVIGIVAGSLHSCARTAGGGAQCWGNNTHGELGDGTLTAWRLVPVAVVGMTSGVVAMAAGLRHTCALASGGAASCWGDDANGQLGDNATTQRLTPVVVSGQGAVKAMAGGGLHTCAVVGFGGVKCWGSNDQGQLGDNSTTQRNAPVDVNGLTGGVAFTTAGASHSCALTTAGGVKCWGDNSFGQLGDNSQSHRLTPVNVSGLASGVKAIAAGDGHTCALTNAGGVKCWGQNSTGQLGDSTTTQRLMPVDVVGLTSGVAAIEAGASHTCALLAAGGVKCWGWNGFGQLGDNSTTQRNAPVDVVGLTSGVSAIAVGQYHSCALIGSGVMCWGWNAYGQLGDNTIIQRVRAGNGQRSGERRCRVSPRAMVILAR